MIRIFAWTSLFAGLAWAQTPGSVADTRHNLSASGPGPVRAANEKEVCIFCHAAHTPASGPALWNHVTPADVRYKPYESAKLAARPGQPDGGSILCLSCHDGTIALGAIRNREKAITVLGGDAGGRLRADKNSNLGSDLSGTHPVSISYDESIAGQDLRAPVKLRALATGLDKHEALDARGKVQCMSCHDPHQDPAGAGRRVPPFWRSDRFQDVCEKCHQASLVDAPHADEGLLTMGCGSCHVGHGVAGEPLLPAREENACFRCHGTAEDVRERVAEGSLSQRAWPTLIEPLFALPHHHPVQESRGEHVFGEDLQAQGAVAPRHVECVDCHALHGEQAPARLAGIRAKGTPVVGVLGETPEYEVCYDCHGAVASLPYGETDKSAEFDPNNPSYHPIEAASRAKSTPSLLSPWREGDLMTCTDCHSGDREAGPRGPHGSSNPWILKAMYTATDGAPESTRTYALCYGCHSRSIVLSDRSWAGHDDHVVTARTSCYACHDSHGSPNNPSLIRFGKDIRYTNVTPSTTGRLEYDPVAGTCTLGCHGTDHATLGYGP